MRKSKRFKPIGCSYAAQQAWNAQIRQSGLKKTFIYNAEPCSAYDCRYRLYDITQTAFIAIVFNQSGTLLAALTANSFLRFIGLKTMCIYASIYMCDYFDETKENTRLKPYECSEAPGTVFMYFFDHDSKIAVKFSESLLIFSLTNSSSISCVMKIHLREIFQQLNYETLLFCKTQVFPFNKASEGDTFSGTSSSPGKSQVLLQRFAEKTTFVGGYDLSNEFQKKTYICDHSRNALYIEQCQILQHSNLEFFDSNSVLDFFIITEPNISVPLRIIWNFPGKTLMSAEVLLPVQTLEFQIKTKNQLRFSIVFAICNFEWDFSYDTQNLNKIQRYNAAINRASWNEETKIYSLWNESINLHAREQHVFCAVAQAPSEIFLQYIFKDFNRPSQTVASVELKNSLSTSTQLIVNKAGSLLLCRSANCLTLVTLSIDRKENQEMKNNVQAFSRFGEDTPKVVFQVVMYYQKPIPRDRLAFCAISNAPSNVNVILLCYGKSNATVQFLQFHERQRSLELNKCIQLSNCKELDQILWIPSTFQWAAVSRGERCILLFGFPKRKETWHLTLSDFSLLTENFEIVESESEFDNKENVTTIQQVTQPILLQSCTLNVLPDVFFTNNSWYTSLILYGSPPIYPFCLPPESSTELKDFDETNQDDTITFLTTHLEVFQEFLDSV